MLLLRRILLPAVLLSLAASIAGFVLVGFLAGPKDVRFEWELASVFGTAVGTTFLAAVTGLLAWSTARDVAATERMAKDAELERLDRVKPTVLVEPVAFDAGYSLRVRVRNVGLGPALGIQVTAKNPDVDRSIGQAYIAALEPESEWTTMFVPVDPTPPSQPSQASPSPPEEWSKMANWKLDGDYLDRYRKKAGDVIDVRQMRAPETT